MCIAPNNFFLKAFSLMGPQVEFGSEILLIAYKLREKPLDLKYFNSHAGIAWSYRNQIREQLQRTAISKGHFVKRRKRKILEPAWN